MSMSEHEFPKRVADTPMTVDWTDDLVMAEWCARFKTTRERVLSAIELVGPMPRAVEFHLRSRSRRMKALTAAVKAQFEQRRQEKLASKRRSALARARTHETSPS